MKAIEMKLWSEKPDHEMESAAIAVQAAATEMNARQRKLERVL